MTPQAMLVLQHLQAHGSITNVEANAVHKVRSVSRRITEIVDAGFNIIKLNRRDTTGQRYVKYVLQPALDFGAVIFVNTEGVAAERLAA